MAQRHTSAILRVQRSNDAKQRLLLHITQIGARSLDLKLVATDRDHLYHASILQSEVGSLQSPQFHGNAMEWEAILRHLLLQKGSPPSISQELFQGLELVFDVNAEVLTATIRKNIGGIIQRLGSIRLQQDDEREEINFFDWVETSIDTCEGLRGRLNSVESGSSTQQARIEALTAQLDDLVQAKLDHEDDLLRKFATLLNAKKLKIRDQQRLLAKAQAGALSAQDLIHDSFRRADRSTPRKRKIGGVTGSDEAIHDARDQSESRSTAPEDDEVDEDGMNPRETPEATNAESEDEGFAPVVEPGPSSSNSVPSAKRPIPSPRDDDESTEDEL